MQFSVTYFRFKLELWCHVEGVLHTIGVNLQLQTSCGTATMHESDARLHIIVVVFVITTARTMSCSSPCTAGIY